MDIEQLESGTFSNETVSLLILNELRVMRQDLNNGLLKLEAKLDHLCQIKKESRKNATSQDMYLVQEEQIVKRARSIKNAAEASMKRIFSRNRKVVNACNVDKKENNMLQASVEKEDLPSYTVHVNINDLPEDAEEELAFEEGEMLNDHDDEVYDAEGNVMLIVDEKRSYFKESPNELERNDEGRYQCSLCPNSYTSKGNLRRHLCYHTGEKRYKCTFCSRQFFRNEYLIRHMKKHIASDRHTVKRLIEHNEESEPDAKKFRDFFECEVCNRMFLSLNKLKQHMQLHKTE